MIWGEICVFRMEKEWLKAHTYAPTLGGSALESALELADSSSESADSNTNPPVGM